jgi:hypothetical protein
MPCGDSNCIIQHQPNVTPKQNSVHCHETSRQPSCQWWIEVAQEHAFGDVAALSAILVLQHWGICIADPKDNEPEYYHLKKLEDSTFALDITPFDPAAITPKVPAHMGGRFPQVGTVRAW